MMHTLDRNLLHAAVDAADTRKIRAIIALLEAMRQEPQSVPSVETEASR